MIYKKLRMVTDNERPNDNDKMKGYKVETMMGSL